MFSPVDSNPPVLSFPKDADDWGHFKIGTTHGFELRKGGLGFYQVNVQPVHVKMREYFIGRRSRNILEKRRLTPVSRDLDIRLK